MLKALINNGKIITAKDNNELLEIMSSFTEESVEEYMTGVKHRCKIWDGSDIEYENVDEFVSEMLRVGVIKKLLINNESEVL